MPDSTRTEPRLPTLNLVGAGRVAQTLASLWHQQGCFAVQDVLTTSLHSAQVACTVVGAGQAVVQMETMRRADIWLLGVPDAQLADCVRALAQVAAISHTGPDGMTTPLVFHCSGAQSTASLGPLAALGWQVASAHCILSFASIPSAIVQFPGTPCALEGHATACATLRAAFSAIGARCFEVASGDKLLYHAAAVFATNFLPVLQATAEDLWQTTGVPADVIAHLRSALLRNAVANITALGPQAALTGPAARGDTEAITRQGAAVTAWDAPTGTAYEALSALALRLAQRRPDAR